MICVYYICMYMYIYIYMSATGVSVCRSTLHASLRAIVVCVGSMSYAGASVHSSICLSGHQSAHLLRLHQEERQGLDRNLNSKR